MEAKNFNFELGHAYRCDNESFSRWFLISESREVFYFSIGRTFGDTGPESYTDIRNYKLEAGESYRSYVMKWHATAPQTVREISIAQFKRAFAHYLDVKRANFFEAIDKSIEAK